MFSKKNTEDPLTFIFDHNYQFNSNTKHRYFAAFKKLEEVANSYFNIYDLLELNNDNPKILNDRNAFTAYCNYIITQTPMELREESFRYKLIKQILSKMGLTIPLDTNHEFKLPSPAWFVPMINLPSILQVINLNPYTGIELYSNAKVALLSDLKYTIFDSNRVVFRDKRELAELCSAIDCKQPSELISYRPKMVALHAALVLITTTIKLMPLDFKNKNQKIDIDHEPYLRSIVKIVMNHAKNAISEQNKILLALRKNLKKMIKAYVHTGIVASGIDENVIKTIQTYRQKIHQHNTELGKFFPSYSQTKALIALTLDSFFNKIAEDSMENVIHLAIEDLIQKGTLSKLKVPKPQDRRTFIVAGGQASGKGSSVMEFCEIANNNCGGWENLYKGGGDAMRLLFFEYAKINSQDINPELFGQLTMMQARYVSHNLIGGRLNELANDNKAPHIFIEQCYIGQDKINLGLLNGGSVLITIVSTEVSDCIERAFQRGKDIGRFESVTDILTYHKKSTEQLPDRINENAGKEVYLRIVDNNVEKGKLPTPIAYIDCEQKTIKILDGNKLLHYIYKIAININAKLDSETYDKKMIEDITIENYFNKVSKSFKIIYEPNPEKLNKYSLSK